MSSFYDTLGIKSDATDQEIKRVYRSMALKYHPDRNTDPTCTETIKKINEAYETLGSPDKRAIYDAQLNHPLGGMNGISPDDMMDINHMFHMMFGGGGMSHGMPNVRVFHQGMGGFPPGMGHPFFQQQQQKPPPIIKSVHITMDQCYHGCSVPIEIEKWTIDAGSNTKQLEKETIYVQIPPGIDSNECIVMRGRGNAFGDNNKGDVKINIEITNDTMFQRAGLDLIYKTTITLKEALCGFSLDIKHINGKMLCLTNKSNTIKPNFKKVIPTMGLRREDVNQAGNLIIEFDVQFPDKLTDEQISVLSNVL